MAVKFVLFGGGLLVVIALFVFILASARYDVDMDGIAPTGWSALVRPASVIGEVGLLLLASGLLIKATPTIHKNRSQNQSSMGSVVGSIGPAPDFLISAPGDARMGRTRLQGTPLDTIWHDEDDQQGNLWHIIGTGEVTKEEVEEVLEDHEGEVELSKESGNPIVFGWTSTGKHIAMVFFFEDDPDLVSVRPKTAFPVPEYGG